MEGIFFFSFHLASAREFMDLGEWLEGSSTFQCNDSIIVFFVTYITRYN